MRRLLVEICVSLASLTVHSRWLLFFLAIFSAFFSFNTYASLYSLYPGVLLPGSISFLCLVFFLSLAKSLHFFLYVNTHLFSFVLVDSFCSCLPAHTLSHIIPRQTQACVHICTHSVHTWTHVHQHNPLPDPGLLLMGTPQRLWVLLLLSLPRAGFWEGSFRQEGNWTGSVHWLPACV